MSRSLGYACLVLSAGISGLCMHIREISTSESSPRSMIGVVTNHGDL